MMLLDHEAILHDEGLEGFLNPLIFRVLSELPAFCERKSDPPPQPLINEVLVEKVLLPCRLNGNLYGMEGGVNEKDLLRDLAGGGSLGPGVAHMKVGWEGPAGHNEGTPCPWPAGLLPP